MEEWKDLLQEVIQNTIHSCAEVLRVREGHTHIIILSHFFYQQICIKYFTILVEKT